MTKAIKNAVYLSMLFWSLLIASSFARAQHHHPLDDTFFIDNLADRQGFGGEPITERPIHDQGSPYAEGQPSNSCFENLTTNPDIGNGHTFAELFRWGMRWRRLDVNKATYLAGMVNYAKGYLEGTGRSHIPIPFDSYDPFNSNPLFTGIMVWPTVHHSVLIDRYNTSPWRDGNYAWDGISIRYDWFLVAQHHYGEQSYLVPAPMKYEGLFNYYDRIPAHPFADACVEWLEGRQDWNYVLELAAAHEQAGREHFRLIRKRVLYLWPFLQLVKDGVIK